MVLTIDSRVIEYVVDNTQRNIQNSFITRERNLAGELITQKISTVGKVDEIITLQKVVYSDLTFLRARQGTDITCSLTGTGDHNFSGTYNLEISEETSKSFNETQNLTIILHKV